VLATSRNPVAPTALRCGTGCDTPVLRARAGRGPAGLRLLVTTSPPTIVDAAGRQHPGPALRLRRDEHVETLLPMGNEAVALVSADYLTDATPPARVYRLSTDGSVTLLGRADALVQGVGATVWTVSYRRTPGSDTLTQLDRTGRVLARHPVTAGSSVVRATRAGLLVTIPGTAAGSYFGNTVRLALLDPATGRVRRVLSDGVYAVLDATEDRVAWSSARHPWVDVYDLTTGTFTAVLDVPGYHPPNYGRFSPDRRSLALGFSGLPQIGSNPASYGYLQVLNLRSGRVTPLAGLRTPPKNDVQLDWTRDSSTLILGVDHRDRARIAFWSARTSTLTMLPKRIRHSEYDRFTYLALRGQ